MKTQQYQTAFTMIELMVVLVITSAIMGLVGSLTIDRYAKSQTKSEILSLKNTIRVYGYRAYATAKEYQLHFEGKSISIVVNNVTVENIVYQHLFFQPQTIQLNTMGFPIQSKLNVLEGDSNTQLDVFALFSEN
jgi:prepilin-type N-terminal cleavage/methylation domain-containing protein